MLAVLPCCDNATKVDDTAHLCCSVFVVARVNATMVDDTDLIRSVFVVARDNATKVDDTAHLCCSVFVVARDNAPYAVLFLLLPATMPQRWMIRPTYAVLFLLLPATMPQR